MKIRRLGSSSRYFDFDDEQDCAWCVAARSFFARNPSVGIVHLENDRGGKRTLTIDPNAHTIECEPYIFFRDD